MIEYIDKMRKENIAIAKETGLTEGQVFAERYRQAALRVKSIMDNIDDSQIVDGIDGKGIEVISIK